MEFTANSQTTTEVTEARDAATPSTQRVRVLAIDDSNDFLTLLKDLLEPQGFDVRPYTNPVKALEVFQREKDNYQLVLLDYYMPQLDGAKTFEWLRKLNPKVKVIVCSGAEELRLRQMQAQHPIDGYIHKPFRVQEALNMIQRIMGDQTLAVA
jgi:two-component system, cell cycle sensor histidine kinase and response regulator CckA